MPPRLRSGTADPVTRIRRGKGRARGVGAPSPLGSHGTRSNGSQGTNSDSVKSSLPTSLGATPEDCELGEDNLKRKWSSPVWAHYDTHEGDEYEDGVPRAFCKYCKEGPVIAIPKTGTSNFKRHTEGCIGAQPFLDGKKFSTASYKEMISLAIIRHGYPFTFVEHEATRNLHSFLNSGCKPISRNTVKNHVMKIHKREHKNLREFMHIAPGKICLTSDMWTSIVGQGYLSLTGHFIDANWNLHAKILNFCHVEPRHTAVVLHDKVFSLLKEWGIHKKVFSITLDNARCNDNMQDLLLDSLSVHSSLACNGEYFHVRCGAHILNLIVQEGLKVIDKGVIKLRKLISFVVGSERRKILFCENAQAAGVDCSRNLSLDCPTRWNSTYKMIERALIYRAAFSNMRRLERIESNLPPFPTEEEWSQIENICALLKPFNDITTWISGRNYPTSNLYLKNVWKIESLLLKYLACEDIFLRNMATMMKAKFDKYWDSYSLVLSFAAMLDPCYKFQFVLFCFRDLDAENGEARANHVKGQFYKLYEEYAAQKSDAAASVEVNANNIGSDELELEGFPMFDDNSFMKSQLDMYLEESRVARTKDFDVLVWWKNNEKRFPIVSTMARDILAIPLTTVASESAFSMGSRIITKWRASLHPQTADALLTTRSWIFGLDVDTGEVENQELDGLEFQLSNIRIDEDDEDDDEVDT